MRQSLRDIAALAARLGVGGIFFANGWSKLKAGLDATGDQFATLGAPVPELWAGTTMLMELLGGALLVAGLAVPVCGLLLFAEALAVFAIANGDRGLPLTGGEISLVVALGAASIMLAVNGAGRLSVDHMVVIKRRDAEAAEDFAADSEADDVLASLREPESAAPVSGDPASRADAAGPGTASPKGPDPKSGGPEDGAPAGGSPGNGESGADTAEFPARPRARRRGTAEQPPPGKRGDTLVAKQKDTPADG
ncbi:DoxX family protein [Planomonospora sp. ID67723]|uniref:DoxX family protein n=1 Tax=Planomonospora sp. ID67723 TaxID=2738134 RepID=UPI0018C3FD53|nr:DoxX family protein [Planomonospora sp. ID67723]MBG0830588.1 DoxX family protein [Planomonospora sp. ID67723]